MDETFIRFGSTVKAYDDGRIEGYLVRYTDADNPDLEGDYFTKDTDFDFEGEREVSVYYNHGLNPDIKERRIGKATMRKDDVGVFIEGQLALRDEYEKAIHKRLVLPGKTGFSSGAVSHLTRFERQENGANFIKMWPIGEASITPTPAAGPELTKVIPIKALLQTIEAQGPEAAGDAAAAQVDDVPDDKIKSKEREVTTMTEQVEKEQPQIDVDAIAAAAADKAVEQAMKAWEARQEQEAKKQAPTNDPGFAGKNVNVAKHSDIWKYDNYSAADLSFTLDVVGAAADGRQRPNEKMVKALAVRLESSEADDTDELPTGAGRTMKTAGPNKHARAAMKRANIKADETNFSTNVGYGDEWIGVAYSGDLWASVRHESGVLQRLPTYEFPAGAESAVMALESTDPVWYLIAQAGDPSGATTQVAYTVPAKALGTAQVSATLGKLGGATTYTGEMVEDSFVPYAAQLRNQIAVSGAEYLESAIIDGDTATTTTTNINDIGGTPGSTDWFLIWNGFRKSGLVTTTANSRDGGVLDSADFLETVKLMGPAGKVGFDRNRVSFILPPVTHWKALELADIKTRDVHANPTIENGNLVRIWGYEVLTSYNYNKASVVNTGYEYKENTAGKIDLDTAANNTKGSILAVRWDHWKLGFRRRMTVEVERIPRADAWDITAIMRASLKQRDTEAAAITYNLTV